MEDRERELYEKLIKAYEDEIARLRAENIKLKVDRDQFKRIDYPINPYPQGPNDWPYNPPFWGINDPRTNERIGPIYFQDVKTEVKRTPFNSNTSIDNND